MPRLFRTIRKKSNRTHFVVIFFIFCIILEVFSHAQTSVYMMAAELAPSESKVCAAERISNYSSDDEQETRLSCSEQKDDGYPLNGGDELNHHHVLTVAFSYNIKMLKSRVEKIISEPADPIFSALPPPYLPPELS